MSRSASTLQDKLNKAACLLIAGLTVELITLIWAHPTSFLLFAGLGAMLVLGGIAVYLFAIVAR